VFHEQSQSTATQLMGCETAALSATAAQLSVTGTIGTLPTHGLVVLFDFDYSCRAGQFDTDGEIFLKGGARICRQRPRSSIFMRAPRLAT
jgi:hypothetical protein